MKIPAAPLLVRCALVMALLFPACRGDVHALTVGGNTATSGFDPISGSLYSEVRSVLSSNFPGSTFTSLPTITGSLGGFDLIILDRFGAQDLQPSEQTAIHDYVLQGGNLLYVGEAVGVSNDTFTLPFGISMAPDPVTNIDLAFASYTALAHPYLNGPFGTPTSPPSGSIAAQVTTLGPSAELARWNGGGIAISAFDRNVLGPGAGFGIFLTDSNMITPGRYSQEVAPVISNALALPEPSTTACLALGVIAWTSRRRSRTSGR